MCGRYTLVHSPDQLGLIFQVEFGRPYELRFNIAPTQHLPVIVARREARWARTMRWGLIPHWSKDEKIGARLINARSETAATLPSFRGPFQKHRCIVPASGFFEWEKTADGKQPYYIKPKDGSVLAFAGLWDRWTASADTVIESFTILTTEPNEVVAPLHDRMPVILSHDAIDSWLHVDPRDAKTLRTLLAPCSNDLLETHPVSRRVNRPANDDPSLLEPVPEKRRKNGDGGVSPGETLDLF